MLSVTKLKTIQPGKQISDRGLRFVHDKRGSKFFSFRTRVGGRQFQWGCGAVDGGDYKQALEAAQKRAASIRQQLGAGTPPELIDRVSEQIEALTPASSLRVVMERFLETKKLEWSNDKHIKQWTRPIERYMPGLLGKAIGTVMIDDVLAELTPIWTSKPETGSRIQQRLSQVFNYGIARGLRSQANPMDRDIIRNILPSPRKLQPVVHHAAVPFDVLPHVYSRLCESDSISCHALRWLMLSAARSGEVRGARWSEIDGDVWIIPTDRMKARKEHRVPITPAMQGILARMREWRQCHGTELIFASSHKHSVLTDVSLSKSLKRYSESNGTVHGLRSSFKDWATEMEWDDYLSEQQLAHADSNKSRSAYRRSDVLSKRRTMMCSWEKFISD